MRAETPYDRCSIKAAQKLFQDLFLQSNDGKLANTHSLNGA